MQQEYGASMATAEKNIQQTSELCIYAALDLRAAESLQLNITLFSSKYLQPKKPWRIS